MENLNVNALRTLAGVLPLFGQQAEGQKGSVVGVADNVRNTSQPVKRSKTDSSQADTKENARGGRSALGDITNASTSNAADKAVGKPLPAASRVVSDSQASEFLAWNDAKGGAASKSVGDLKSSALTSYLPEETVSNAGTGSSEKKRRRDWVDVDALNEDNPLACPKYAVQIFNYLREAELTKRANPYYIQQLQPDMNANMRSILIDWLVEVVEEYRLCADTLYLTINYVDRFLSLHTVSKSQLQLVGVTCMWIASKYEEIYAPTVGDFCFITDNTYTKEQIIHMEELVLKKLGYELTVPTSKTFLRRLLQLCNPDEKLHFMANYITELALVDYAMLPYPPSKIAASAVYLAQVILHRTPWDGTLAHYSTYGHQDLHPCVQDLALIHCTLSSSDNTQLPAIRDKYAHPKYHSVSRMPGVAQSQLAHLLATYY